MEEQATYGEASKALDATQTVVTGKEIKLTSGKIAVIQPFKGRHIMQAQRIAGGDQERFLYALIAMLTTIDGQGIVLEDLEAMDGRDVLKLMGEFSEANF